MHIAKDRVRETTTTTGTGAITLAGAPTGFQAFSAAMAANDTCFYCISGGAEWEVGLGQFNTTLSRLVVLESSNADDFVDFAAGTKDVFITFPAALGYDELDPTAPYTVVDDFMSGSETGEIGDRNWSITTGTITKLDGIQAHPGIVRFNGTTTANQVRSFHYTAAVGDQMCRWDEFDTTIFIVREATAGQTDLTWQSGIFDALGNTTPTHGVYLEIKPADSNYFLVSRNGGSETRVDTGVARGSTWLKIKIRRVSATVVQVQVNNGSISTITTTLPDAADTIIIGTQHAQTGTTARNVDIDFWSFRLRALNR